MILETLCKKKVLSDYILRHIGMKRFKAIQAEVKGEIK
jgi:hypothetical protein